MRRLTQYGTPRAILAELAARRFVDRRAMLRRAKELAGSNSAALMALKRLQDQGLVVCEFRLTPEGAKALAEGPKC